MNSITRFASRHSAIVKGLILCVGALLPGGAQLAVAQQKTPAPTEPIKPVISFNLLMVDFVDQASDAIWTAAVHPPKRKCEWDQVEYRATQLATTGTLLRVGGTGPLDMAWAASPRWAMYADNMTQIALAAAKAAREKNIAELNKVGGELDSNCEACHREFKPEIPTQNIATHLSHAEPLSEELPPNCRKR